MTPHHRPPFSAGHRFALLLTLSVAFLIRLLHVVSHAPVPAGPALRSPGYLLLQELILALAPGDAEWMVIRIFQALLGALTVWLVARLARRIHSRRAGLAAALMACFFQHHLFMTGTFLSQNLSTPLFLLALLLGLRALERRTLSALFAAGLSASAAFWSAGAALSLTPLLATAVLAGKTTGRARARRLAMAGGGIAALTALVVAGSMAAGTSLSVFPGAEGYIAGDFWGSIYQAGRAEWGAFWEASQPLPLRTLNPSLLAGEIFFPWVSWRLVLWTGLLGLGFLLRSGSRAGRITLWSAALFVCYFLLFDGDGRDRLPLEGIFLAWSGVAVAGLMAAAPLRGPRRSTAWATVASIVLVVVVTEASASGMMVRRGLADPSSGLATAQPLRVGSGSRPLSLFGETPLPLDRSRGRYLRLSLMARRSGAGRPFRGLIRISFLHPDGRTRSWLDTPSYSLQGLPPDRWVPVELKVHIPPSAVSCRVEIISRSRGYGPLRVDHAALRYSGGNDLALEFLFPYLRAER